MSMMDNLVAEAGQSLEFKRLEPQRMTAVLKLMEGSDVFVALPWVGREASVWRTAIVVNRRLLVCGNTSKPNTYHRGSRNG